MTPNRESRAAFRTHLRFVYTDRVVSFCLGRTPTFSDIASAMSELTRFGAAPRAIDVTFLSSSPAMSSALDMHDAQ